MDEYEINISFDGLHWGKVTLPGSTTLSAALDKAMLLQRALDRETQAHKSGTATVQCTVTRWTRIGYPIDVGSA